MLTLITIAATGIIILYTTFFKSRKLLVPIAITGALTALAFNISDWNTNQLLFNNMMKIDNYSVAFNSVMILSLILILLLSHQYFKGVDKNVSEIYSLLFFSFTGACLLTSFNNFTMLFIGIETMSIPLYVLAGSKKFSIRSNEASFKYFIMGSFATAIFLLGVALVYGVTGSFNMSEVSEYISATAKISSLMKLGILFIVISIGFKIAAAPFHFWAPDVYEGSPTLVTTYMATVVKVAGIAALLRLLTGCFIGAAAEWQHILEAFIILSFVIGNFGAIQQQSVKRMLAYSSISHTGFMLLAIIAINQFSASSLLYYSLSYSLATIAAFAVLILVKNYKNSDASYESFNGLAKHNPFLAFVMLTAMLSMTGIPITAGFFAKYYVFLASVKSGYSWLVICAIIAALVGVAYYFRIIINMYYKESNTEKIIKDNYFVISLIIATAITLAVGILPQFIIGLI